MHNGAAAARETYWEPEYREVPETSLLDAMVEAAVPVARVRPVPMADSILSQMEAPAGKYSRGRRIVVRDVEVARQDSNVLCQGGLFGSVEPAATPQGHRAAIQEGLFAAPASVAARAGSVCVVCGDPRCDIRAVWGRAMSAGKVAAWGRPVRPASGGSAGQQVYYDYDLQVWVVRGHVSACGHPETMRPFGGHCCNGHKYARLWIEEARVLEGLPAVEVDRG